MKFKNFTLGPTGPSATWEIGPDEAEVARRVILFLENRRVLFGERHMEDEMHCVTSAIEIRNYLTTEMASTRKGGFLECSLRAMRLGCERFVDAAGPNAQNFVGSAYPQTAFWLALGELRALVGQQLGMLSSTYDIEIEHALAQIVPVEPERSGPRRHRRN